MDEKEIKRSDEASLPSDNSNELYNLVQSIQSKLNNESSSNNTYKEIDDKDINNTTKNIDYSSDQDNSNNNNTYNQNTNNKFDLSNLGSILQNLDISTILNTFGGSSKGQNNNDTNAGSGFNLGDIDPSTIFRIQKIISSMSKKDAKKDLLLSLKPFLRKSRQDKIGEYVTMLTVANALGIFDRKGSDEDV